MAPAGNANGSGVFYAAPGMVFENGSSTADFTITGGLLREFTSGVTSLELTISSLDETMSLAMSFNPAYYRDSSLAPSGAAVGTPVDQLPGVVSGVYTVRPLFAPYDDLASLSVDADGAFFSQTASGCVANGQVTVIDPEFNGFAANMTMSNCARLNGMYHGVAFFPYLPEPGREVLRDLDIAVFSDTNAIAAVAR